MLPPPATTDQVGENETMVPAESLPSARNCRVAEAGIVSGPAGVTVMLASGCSTGAAGGVTVTFAEPTMLPSVAVTVLRNVPGVEPATNRPCSSMVPPFATTDQMGLMSN